MRCNEKNSSFLLRQYQQPLPQSTAHSSDQANDINALCNLEWLGDAKMQTFLHLWGGIVENMPRKLDDDTRCDIFIRHLRTKREERRRKVDAKILEADEELMTPNVLARRSARASLAQIRSAVS